MGVATIASFPAKRQTQIQFFLSAARWPLGQDLRQRQSVAVRDMAAASVGVDVEATRLVNHHRPVTMLARSPVLLKMAHDALPFGRHRVA